MHEYSYLKHLENKCSQSLTMKHSSSTSNVVSPLIHPANPPSSPPTLCLNDNRSTDGSIHRPADGSRYPFFYAPDQLLDPDTPLSPYSLAAAKHYCGAAILAVDKLMDPRCTSRAAFVVGRPPGHHAGPNGCVPSEYFWKIPQMTSSGFCLLNTVAVAAGYCTHYD